MTQWKKILISMGFSEAEANVYLTTLEMGPTTVQDIAKKAKVSRVTTYAVIESLGKVGLMSSVEKGKKRFFQAESPERLASFVQARVKQMEGTLREVESSLHELKMVQRGEKPVVKMFEGVEGIKAITDDILLTKPNEAYEIGNISAIQQVLPKEVLKPFKEGLDKQKIQSYAIFINPEHAALRASTKLKVANSKRYDFTGDVIVYGDKLALSTFAGKHISVIIENKEIAETMKQVFKMAWDGTEVE
jgi:sugar-specific transcriptional regulator TrmB